MFSFFIIFIFVIYLFIYFQQCSDSLVSYNTPINRQTSKVELFAEIVNDLKRVLATPLSPLFQKFFKHLCTKENSNNIIKHLFIFNLLSVRNHALKYHENCKNDLYFKLAKSKYEKYIYKKWVERKYLFESKQTFITRASAERKSSNDAEREQFLDALATAVNKTNIKNIWFNQNTKIIS